MGLERDIASIRRRLNKIEPIVNPPELKMQVISGNDPVPVASPWSLTVYIESKEETLGN